MSSSKIVFPATDGRRYSSKWEEKFPWLRYLVQKDAAFCINCLAFCNYKDGDVFTDKGFNDWKNATGSKREVLLSHNESKTHQQATNKTINYKQIVSKEEKDIYVSISKSYEEKVKGNREILFRIIDTIVVLGQQNIPLRGHNWNKEKKIEDGNFSRFLQWKADDVPILKSHLENAPYNAQYTSPDIQNELISFCGLQIKNTILKKVQEAKWFSIMADESTDVGTKEQMALCIRYVDRTATVFEDFIGFIEMEKVNAESIATAIVNNVQECGLNMDNLHGQGYDGASVMSGNISGVKARIQQIQPKEYYHHCRTHVLNLVVATSCKALAEIRNLFDSVSQLTWFLGGSAKQMAIVSRYLSGDDTDKLVISGNNEDEPMLNHIN
ncbi:unnamed protein product [Mytilus coruscus]|uniref:TTF-type domain-containing protein n=1 Tax=Mytilus coruscus TaxID=42192 RepID=A0A6J8CRE9_MYTCO|nr:unnamed protein product [Mytilus coruscus]